MTTRPWASHRTSSRRPRFRRATRHARMDFDIRANSAIRRAPAATTRWRSQCMSATRPAATCLNEYQAARTAATAAANHDSLVSVRHRPMNGEEGVITVALAGFSTLALSLSGIVSIICDLTDEAFEKWQTHDLQPDHGRLQPQARCLQRRQQQERPADPDQGPQPVPQSRDRAQRDSSATSSRILLCNYFNGIGSMMERRRAVRLSGDRLREAREGCASHPVLRAGVRVGLRRPISSTTACGRASASGRS